MIRVPLVALLLALSTTSGSATTYSAVTFNELVARADIIFVGEVVDVRPVPVTVREGAIIKTRVIFRVFDAIYGTSSTLEVFDFLGGEYGGVGMAVAEMPTFTVGDRRVIFARRGQSINPIVGFTQGLLRIIRDESSVDRVFALDGVPIRNTDQIGQSRSLPSTSAVPMRLSDLRSRISDRLAAMRRR
ncbi:MAG: hypothetical protein A3F70_01340 [Acidobacteria bacterium RIFCSPLOWO2_12_FULL_67_14]|nr:MAG: hypothetical protein A3H29_12475 [Acidobacteria bacterium RIFCSPLOWO2_02_FULL_67_21]OFW38439.1 MAG: hypothetical protein A3F70_01340 [Acidobacteria bacterium RIFCSPLOWO2_12_FULL_67_14]